MGCIAIVIWLGLWLGHKAPYLLGGWNPWNLALIVIVAVALLEGKHYENRRASGNG